MYQGQQGDTKTISLFITPRTETIKPVLKGAESDGCGTHQLFIYLVYILEEWGEGGRIRTHFVMHGYTYGVR